ncbi:hypothetical protein GCM10009854_26750 [Saccharopolyspora halophila]|uniref:Uncharacterized protein n=1 Tax=Saccharopolyspora halophila TaxID=405551 RepID=A0ABN3GBX4_9PSEU
MDTVPALEISPNPVMAAGSVNVHGSTVRGSPIRLCAVLSWVSAGGGAFRAVHAASSTQHNTSSRPWWRRGDINSA